ncbi:cyclic nucleotide-binding domain-containing protein [Variovorax sp. HJSM1_2]|uniref:cyclic nucleotide-binding domain-containing protein n=1 Tax=Variovorax sp. HJSM1_2 TaxID=3366263 RepID=UPI003BC87EAE
MDAIAQNTGIDALMLKLSSSQWETLTSYMQKISLPAGQLLFKQGAIDRTLYLVESGALSVHFEDRQGQIRLAIVGAGSAVGEGGFFTHMPRSATVQATSLCCLWSLSPQRFAELSHRRSEIALEVALAAGAVVSKRLAHRKQRAAVT